MTPRRIGTVDLPDRMDREHYFRALSYLELSALFAGPVNKGIVAKWASVTPARATGLVAPWVLTHRQPPRAAKLWAADPTVGDFRDSGLGRIALGQLAEACKQLAAAHAVFRSPPLFAPSVANRDQLRAFFGEVATAEALGVTRVWIPDGLWEARAAVKFATELGVVCAIDPLVRDPSEPLETLFDLEAPELYFRIGGLGHAGPLTSDRQDDLAELSEHYGAVPLTIVFESQARWQDAKALAALVAEQLSASPEDAALDEDDSEDLDEADLEDVEDDSEDAPEPDHGPDHE